MRGGASAAFRYVREAGGPAGETGARVKTPPDLQQWREGDCYVHEEKRVASVAVGVDGKNTSSSSVRPQLFVARCPTAGAAVREVIRHEGLLLVK